MSESAAITETSQTDISTSSQKAPWLKPHHFQPGKSGNPGGRPKKLTRLLERELKRRTQDGSTRAQKLIEAAVTRAIGKSDKLVELVWDRIEGKPDGDTSSGPTIVVINQAVVAKPQQ